MLQLTPEELQQYPTKLNPQELMEQLHFMLKATTISFSIKEHRKRKVDLARKEQKADSLNNDLTNPTITAEEIENIREELQNLTTKLEEMEEHTAKGTSIRARLEWDINGEGPGKILLKFEERLGQQKYMSSIIKKTIGGK